MALATWIQRAAGVAVCLIVGVLATTSCAIETVENAPRNRPVVVSTDTAGAIHGHCRRVGNSEASGEGNNYPGLPNTVWRCKGGEVYTCYLGASGRACDRNSISRSPDQGLRSFCQKNPGARSVPNAVQRGSSYQWACRGTAPVITGSDRVDSMGYFIESWRRQR